MNKLTIKPIGWGRYRRFLVRFEAMDGVNRVALKHDVLGELIQGEPNEGHRERFWDELVEQLKRHNATHLLT